MLCQFQVNSKGTQPHTHTHTHTHTRIHLPPNSFSHPGSHITLNLIILYTRKAPLHSDLKDDYNNNKHIQSTCNRPEDDLSGLLLFIIINSCNTHNPFSSIGPSFHRYENWGPEKLSKSPKVTQLVRSRAGSNPGSLAPWEKGICSTARCPILALR